MADPVYDPDDKYDHPDPAPQGGTQDESISRYPAIAIRGVGEGLGSDVGGLGDLIRKYGGESSYSGIRKLAGMAPSSDEVNQALSRWGISDPQYTPQTLGEREVYAAAKGAGAALPLALVAGPGPLVSGALSGASEQTAKEVFKDQPEVLKYAAPAAALLGGSLTGVGPKAVSDVAGMASDLASGNWQRMLPVILRSQAGNIGEQVFSHHMQGVGALIGAFSPTLGHVVKNAFTHPEDIMGGLVGSYANAPPIGFAASPGYDQTDKYDYPAR